MGCQGINLDDLTGLQLADPQAVAAEQSAPRPLTSEPARGAIAGEGLIHSGIRISCRPDPPGVVGQCRGAKDPLVAFAERLNATHQRRRRRRGDRVRLPSRAVTHRVVRAVLAKVERAQVQQGVDAHSTERTRRENGRPHETRGTASPSESPRSSPSAIVAVDFERVPQNASRNGTRSVTKRIVSRRQRMSGLVSARDNGRLTHAGERKEAHKTRKVHCANHSAQGLAGI